MPVTVKLSKGFYDRFGDDLANELVDLLNMIAASYESELRDLNERNWTRFDAKLETFKAEVRAELKEMKADLIKWMFVFWAGTAFASVLLKAFG